MNLTTYETSTDWWKQYYSVNKTLTGSGNGSHLTSNPNQDSARAMSTLARQRHIKGSGENKSIKRRSTVERVRRTKRKGNLTLRRVKKKKITKQKRRGPPSKRQRKIITKTEDVFSKYAV